MIIANILGRSGFTLPSQAVFSAAVLASLVVGPGSAAAATLKVLYNFRSTNPVGASPKATLIPDASGALYGTAFEGGNANLGTVFRLAPPESGQTAWTAAPLHRFSGGSNGSRPAGALAAGPGGVLFGAAQLGGGAGNDGTLFQLSPPSGGGTVWTFKTIHRFTGGDGGSNPFAGVVRAPDGTLYGTTFQGGSTGWGTVFSLTPPQAGHTAWKHRTLYSFLGSPDAGSPQASLTLGPDAALYGTTKLGGSANLGTVFKLSPPASGHGAWKESVLHDFAGAPADGAGPLAGVAFDPAGNLYGTASFGGKHLDSGVVFRLAPPAPGHKRWSYRILHHLTRTGGASPQGDLVVATGGALFVTAAFGGAHNAGVVFKLVPPATPDGAWARTTLHQFSGTTEGAFPIGGLYRKSNGQIFGVAGAGGKFDAGTIYRIVE